MHDLLENSISIQIDWNDLLLFLNGETLIPCYVRLIRKTSGDFFRAQITATCTEMCQIDELNNIHLQFVRLNRVWHG